MSDTAETVKAVFLMALIGVAILLMLVLVVYIMAIVVDNYCCCNVDSSSILFINHNDIDRSLVARKAGLWGVSSKERIEIIKKILIGKPYSKDNEQLNNEGAIDDADIESDISNGTNNNEEIDNDDNDPKEKSDTDNDSNNADRDDKNDTIAIGENYQTETCAICLIDYEDGVNVVSGTSCNHIFHYDCVLEWLKNYQHDECPFCRKEMIKPSEYRNAAKEILCPERFEVCASFYRNNRNYNSNEEDEESNVNTNTNDNSTSSNNNSSTIELQTFTANDPNNLDGGDNDQPQEIRSTNTI